MGKTSDILSPETHTSLPQYGFGPELSFSSLVNQNPFLFRVYTPKLRSPFYDNTEPFFVGQKFNESFTHTSQPLPEPHEFIPLTISYHDVAIHMDWTTRSSSPFISTSFSLIWSIWEAVRRYHINVKHDIEIAVIDAKAVADHAVTALELLRQSKPKERHRDYWKWYRFASESQDVLVYGAIPGTAVLASIPLLSVLDKLPSYFIRPQEPGQKISTLGKIEWHPAGERPSYRQFCQDISQQFLLMPSTLRLRDTTAQSVRLAVTLLRPWFHKMVGDDFPHATSKLCELAFVISQWPGQWWVRDHGEMWDLIRNMVHVLGEEMQEQRRVQISQEVQRLPGVADGLDREIEHDQTPIPPTPVERMTTAPSSAPEIKHISILETASCLVTGLLIGAFVSLCILSTQRRTLANHLT